MSNIKRVDNYSSVIHETDSDQILSLLHEQVVRSWSIMDENLRASATSFLNVDADTSKSRIHIIYVIDPYDIFEYCFPFGFRMQKAVDGSVLDRQSDQLTAWDVFFSKVPQVILMDEHRPELGRLKIRLLRDIDKQIAGFAEFEKLVVEIYGGYEREISPTAIDKLKQEILHKKLPWLLAAATGELYNGPRRLEKILSKLVINPRDTRGDLMAPWLSPDVGEKHVSVLREVFSSIRASSNAFHEYQNWVDSLEELGVEVDGDRRSNLLVDFKVVDRIISINERLAELQDDLGCRYIVQYLSSDSKSKWISKRFHKRFPKVLGQPFSLIRNVSQLWLKYLMSAGLSEEGRNYDSRLVQNLMLAYSTSKNGSLLHDERLWERVVYLREQVEWAALIKNISSYRGKLLNVFEQLERKANFEPLKRAFAELVSILNRTSSKEGLVLFEKNFRSYNIQVTVFQKLITVLEADVSPAITAAGYVVGINHHLPILFGKINNGSIYEDLIDQAVYLILSPNGKASFSEKFKSFSENLKTVLLTDTIPDLPYGVDVNKYTDEIVYYQRQVLLHLFALLLPAQNLLDARSDGEPYFDKEYNLDSELDELILFDITYLKSKIADSTDGSASESNYALILENLLYIRVWSLRRNNKLEELFFALEEIRDYFIHKNRRLDPRFVHGQALLSYSNLLAYIDNRGISLFQISEKDIHLNKHWKQVIRDVELAVFAFESSENQYDSFIVNKSYSALLNTLVYCYILGYCLSYDFQRLAAARRLVDDKLLAFDFDCANNPEYIHTLAMLEYFEAVHSSTDNFELSIEKLASAYEGVTRCIRINEYIFPGVLDNDYQELLERVIFFGKSKFDLILKS